MKKIMFILLKLSLMLILGIVFCSWNAPDEKPQQQKRKKLMILTSVFSRGNAEKGEDCYKQIFLIHRRALLEECVRKYSDKDSGCVYVNFNNYNHEEFNKFCRFDDRLNGKIVFMGDSVMLVCSNNLGISDLTAHIENPAPTSIFEEDNNLTSEWIFSKKVKGILLNKANWMYHHSSLVLDCGSARFFTDRGLLKDYDAMNIILDKNNEKDLLCCDNGTIYNPYALCISWYEGDSTFTDTRCVDKGFKIENNYFVFNSDEFVSKTYKWPKKIQMYED